MNPLLNPPARVLGVACAVSISIAAPFNASAHDHVNAGAVGSTPGAQLSFINGDHYSAESGFVLFLEKAETGPHANLYQGGLSFTALASSLDYGGPAPGHAAPGAHLVLQVESLAGPANASFGFWEGADEEDGPRLMFETPTGTLAGTNRFALSETAGNPGDDPYGHIHGRVFTLSRPGLFTIGLRIFDTSSNGPDGGPLHPPSELFRLNMQAGVSIARVESVEGGWKVVFAAAQGHVYQIEATDRFGPAAEWSPVGEPVTGANRLVEVTIPSDGAARFFRLRRDPA
jgi:hypothetical protein